MWRPVDRAHIRSQFCMYKCHSCPYETQKMPAKPANHTHFLREDTRSIRAETRLESKFSNAFSEFDLYFLFMIVVKWHQFANISSDFTKFSLYWESHNSTPSYANYKIDLIFMKILFIIIIKTIYTSTLYNILIARNLTFTIFSF